jgi:hypothetical protein
MSNSLLAAVTTAAQHVTPESRATAAMIDRLEARGVTLAQHEAATGRWV